LLAELLRRGLPPPPELLAVLPRPLTFREWVDRVRPGYRWYRHVVVLADVLQDVAEGRKKRVMVFEPPRHGKSEEVSRLFSGYYLHRHPTRWVGLASYGAELAYTLARAAHEHYLRGGGTFKDAASAVKHAETPRGGGMWAAGVGGPITGKGWHLGIIDDPIKNAEEALSPTIRAKQKEWYASTFLTREMPDLEAGDPDGAIVLVQTRWNDDDLAGWLLAQEQAAADDPDDGDPERWHVVNFAAVREDDGPAFPPTCTVEPDWRAPGEPLCPELRPLKKLRSIEKKVGAYYWAALYQQRPRPREGLAFKAAWIRRWTPEGPDLVRLHAPDGSSTLVRVAHCRRFTTGDLAASTRTTADWTVGATWLATPESDLVLWDLERERTATPAHLFRRVFLRHRPAYLAMGANGLGLPIVHELRRGGRDADGVEHPGLPVRGIVEHLDKLANAQAAIVRMEAGQVYLPANAPWLGAFEAELLGFPNGVHDDQVDCLSHAANDVFWSGGAGEPDEVTADRDRAEREAAEAEHFDVNNEHWWT
jgi:predicted phage terminase large subunit-like protein